MIVRQASTPFAETVMIALSLRPGHAAMRFPAKPPASTDISCEMLMRYKRINSESAGWSLLTYADRVIMEWRER